MLTIKIIIRDYFEAPDRAHARGNDLAAKGWAVRYDVDALGRYFIECLPKRASTANSN